IGRTLGVGKKLNMRGCPRNEKKDKTARSPVTVVRRNVGSKRRRRQQRRSFFSSRRRYTRSIRDWSSDVCSSDLEHTSDFFSSRRRHTRSLRDWSSDVCSSD